MRCRQYRHTAFPTMKPREEYTVFFEHQYCGTIRCINKYWTDENGTAHETMAEAIEAQEKLGRASMLTEGLGF